ncbi:MAG TPA: GNAT family N-acetyltransferase [Candidatus Eremiobacteraceae bacterium]|nr:GNAT family N-acetyltransferase [Candidatus Eremiobacteraceae bacterium]
MIRVRTARADDQSFIHALGIQSALDTISGLRTTKATVAAQSFDRLLEFCKERLGTVTFVAEQDDQRAGFLVMLTDVPDEPTQLPQGFIAYVAVEERRRGQGVGRALVRAAAQEAQRRRLPYVSLMVGSHNHEARELYRSEQFGEERILMTKTIDTGAT